MFQQVNNKALTQFVHLSSVAILGYEDNSGFEDNPRAPGPEGREGDGCEGPTRELLTCIKRTNVKKIGDLLHGWVGVESPGLWVSKTMYTLQFNHLDLVTGACLEASVTLGTDFVVLSVFLGLVT